MKHVRSFNYARPRDAWLMVFDHEWDALGGLPAWATRLFLVLVSLSDFKTGHGKTGYGELINALTPDQPARGPRLWAPTRDDVKAMLQRFEQLLILARDKHASETRMALFFHLAPRTSKTTSAEKLPRKLSPGSTEVKGPKLPPQIAPGLSEKNSYPLPPADAVLSTADPIHVGNAIAQAKAVADRIRGRRGGRTDPPPGG